METWRETLAAGDSAAAWDQFITRYHRLIHSVIRRTLANEDDVSEVFSEVCGDLCSDDLVLLSKHTDAGRGSFSTWLVTVVHHRTIDWVRRRDGRRRITPPAGLSALQQQIFERIIVEHRSHVEAYEVIRQRMVPEFSFGAFMKEVTATFEILERTSGRSVAHYFPGAPVAMAEAEREPYESLMLSESASSLVRALEILPADERLAVQLFVVDELPAADVARTVGWPNAKAVYNRVYRALNVLRRELERRGTDPRAG